MTDDERKMLKEMHDFWFQEPVQGGRTRAQEIHEMLTARRSLLWMGRALLYISGLVAAGATVWAAVRGFWEPPTK